MSKTEHNTHQTHHTTAAPYVIGFVLSLIFTIIPYYLVVNHVISGRTALIGVIVGIGFVQMAIQMVFFLHLGREKKPRWQLIFLIMAMAGIFAVVVGSIWIMHHLHYNMTPVTPADISKKLVNDEGIAQIDGKKTGACDTLGTNHQIIFKDGKVSPEHTVASKCDTLTFISEDGIVRNVTLTDVYAGQASLPVSKGHNETITLSETGTYRFRGGTGSSASGDFTVAPQ